MVNELERVWKGRVVGYCMVLSRYILGSTEENCEKPSVMIIGLRAQILTQDSRIILG
jgi:hypothetical protein